MNDKAYCVYIMTNEWNTTFYIGISGELIDRVRQHKEKLIEGFTKRYNLTKLVYYECGDDAEGAITREKEIKKWRREKKTALIIRQNPDFKDLFEELKQ